MQDEMKCFKKCVLIVAGIFLLVFIAVVNPVSAFTINPNNAYSLQGQLVTSYNTTDIVLQNGTIILVDAVNISIYLPQLIVVDNSKQAPTFYTNQFKYNTENITVNNITPYAPNVSVRIQPGDCVTLGETIDISGEGWYTGELSYYGPYYDGYSDDVDSNIVATYSIDAWNLSHVYIDKSFANYPGNWYIYYEGEAWGSNTTSGYDKIFRVADTCEKSNETIAQQYVNNITYLNQVREANLSALPEKTEYGVDLIISRNDTTTVSVSNQSRIWLFGRVTGIYDARTSVDNTTTFWGDKTVNLESGLYDMIEVNPDALGLYETTYDSVHQTINSPFKSLNNLYVGNLQPELVETTLRALINSSPDTIATKSVIDIQNPDIQIMKLDQWQSANNATLFEIAGYTNCNPGDNLTIIYDLNKTIPRYQKSWHVTSWGNISAYRQWNLTFDLNIQNEAPGPHYLTVIADDGATATVPFYISHELPPEHQDQVYLNYIGNNPFIPTPTPITITKEVPVTVTVTVPVIEKIPVDYGTLAFNIVVTAIPYVIVGAILIIVLFYLLSSALVVIKRRSG